MECVFDGPLIQSFLWGLYSRSLNLIMQSPASDWESLIQKYKVRKFKYKMFQDLKRFSGNMMRQVENSRALNSVSGKSYEKCYTVFPSSLSCTVSMRHSEFGT